MLTTELPWIRKGSRPRSPSHSVPHPQLAYATPGLPLPRPAVLDVVLVHNFIHSLEPFAEVQRNGLVQRLPLTVQLLPRLNTAPFHLLLLPPHLLASAVGGISTRHRGRLLALQA